MLRKQNFNGAHLVLLRTPVLCSARQLGRSVMCVNEYLTSLKLRDPSLENEHNNSYLLERVALKSK